MQHNAAKRVAFRLSSLLLGNLTRSKSPLREEPMHRVSIVRTFTLALATAPLFAGCAGGRMSPATPAMPAGPMTPAVIPFSDDSVPDTAVTVGVRLTGEKALQSVHYGKVLGYFRGRVSMTAQVVM